MAPPASSGPTRRPERQTSHPLDYVEAVSVRVAEREHWWDAREGAPRVLAFARRRGPTLAAWIHHWGAREPAGPGRHERSRTRVRVVASPVARHRPERRRNSVDDIDASPARHAARCARRHSGRPAAGCSGTSAMPAGRRTRSTARAASAPSRPTTAAPRSTAPCCSPTSEGSTTLAERMRPAEFRALMGRFYDEAFSVLIDFNAIVDKFVGDEVIGIFIPAYTGQEHARHALDAAHRLLEVTGHGHPDGPWIPIGIGVNSGIAFVGSVGQGPDTELTAMGDTVNVAARLASAAGPGEILVTLEAAQAGGVDLRRPRATRSRTEGQERADIGRRAAFPWGLRDCCGLPARTAVTQSNLSQAQCRTATLAGYDQPAPASQPPGVPIARLPPDAAGLPSGSDVGASPRRPAKTSTWIPGHSPRMLVGWSARQTRPRDDMHDLSEPARVVLAGALDEDENVDTLAPAARSPSSSGASSSSMSRHSSRSSGRRIYAA